MKVQQRPNFTLKYYLHKINTLRETPKQFSSPSAFSHYAVNKTLPQLKLSSWSSTSETLKLKFSVVFRQYFTFKFEIT